ncbi:MAG: membrane protein insertase YidC [Flavobacteriaceae bacterium]|nr:membrane protein insertase YidC [Flavobacteriaceae bacterium]
MEENKIDPYQILGFVILMIAFVWYVYTVPEINSNEISSDLDRKVDSQNEEMLSAEKNLIPLDDDTQDFNDVLNTNKFEDVHIDSEDLSLKIDSKGGMISEVLLKKFDDYKGDSLYLVKNGNHNFSIQFVTTEGKTVDSKNLFFDPEIIYNNDETKVTMSLEISNKNFLNFEYIIPKKGYMIDFSVKSFGFNNIVNDNEKVLLNWDLKAFRLAKSVDYENRYSQLYYQYEGDDTDYLSSYSDSSDNEDEVSWISYGQHFFNTILVFEDPSDNVFFESKKMFEDQGKDVLFTKNYTSIVPIKLKGGEFDSKFNWFMGPNDYDVLKKYENEIYESIYFGWGIFGWINRFIYFPLFGFLSNYFSAGLAVIIMTIITRLAMSPVTYKTYLSQARMKVIRPEIMELNEKFKNDAIKKQQETMKLYNKAGANPLLGCVPALFQLPVFYALFCFFPIAFQLRGKPFLWAEDLSSYDVIAELPFSIPWYGDHVSLLPILASIAIFFYTMMSSGAQMQPTQPGMPNMKFIMYLMPVMMLFFFNNYASAFSLYYFVSNILTILLMLAIKYFIIDERKIHLQIQENKKKPSKQNRFQRKMKEMMDRAEEQRKLQNKK